MGNSTKCELVRKRPFVVFTAVILGLWLFAGLLSERSDAAPTSPTLSIASPESLIVQEQTTVQAILTGSDAATGTIVFSVYDGDDPTCSDEPLADLPPLDVDGDGSYDQLILPPETGTFYLIARYSGDANNDAAANGCGDAGSVLNVIDPGAVVCPPQAPKLSIRTFPRPRPFGGSPQVLGTRVAIRAADSVIAEIRPTMKYRIGEMRKSAPLTTRALRLNRSKRVRFRAPEKLIRDFKRAGLSPRRARVNLQVRVRLRALDFSGKCFPFTQSRLLKTRLTGVSRRVAVRRLGSAKNQGLRISRSSK